MTTLQEIEAALPQLSAEELAQVEALILSVRREREEQTTTPTTTSNAADRPKRKMVPSPYNNGLWVLEAVPGVVVTEEMIKKILDDDDEADFREYLARRQAGEVNGVRDGEKSN